MTATDDGQEIKRIREAFEAAENRGDPTVQIERRDPLRYRRLPPGRPAMDYDEAAAALERLYERSDLSVTWESDGVFVSGDLAIDSGTFAIEIDDAPPRGGSWLMVYRRNAEGVWRVIRDMYNWDE